MALTQFGDLDYRITPTAILNAFLTERLRAEMPGAWGDPAEKDPQFIVPDQEQPEDVDNVGGYIVYTTIKTPGSEIHYIEREQIMYTLYHSSSTIINSAMNLIQRYLNQWDQSAALISRWANENDLFSNREIDFHAIRVISGNSAQPAIDEGGRKDANIIVDVQYIDDHKYSWDKVLYNVFGENLPGEEESP